MDSHLLGAWRGMKASISFNVGYMVNGSRWKSMVVEWYSVVIKPLILYLY